VNATVTLSGTIEEVAEVLKHLRQHFPSLAPVGDQAEASLNEEEDFDPLPLEPRQIERIYLASSPGAREVLRAVAELGGTCSNADVQQKVGLKSGSEVGGRLSSYGRALKRLKLTKRLPLYRYDYVQKIFHMESNVAQIILGLV